MIKRTPKIEKEIDELINSNNVSSESIYNLFLKYESNNIKQINKLTRIKKVEVNRIKGGLKQTIKAHGPIDSKLIGSATKRIYGALLSNETPKLQFHLNSFVWGLIAATLIIILLK
jgi:hypothetical protein